LGLAGVDSASYAPDGQDIWPVLSGDRAGIDRDIFWQHHDNAAIRRGDWKFVREDGAETLHDLSADPSERDDLATSRPDLAGELRRALAEWESAF
jgi:arylsulfatase A-like enzyme